MLPAKQLSGKSQPSWLPRQTHPHSLLSHQPPAERLAEITTLRQGLRAQRVSKSPGNPERPDPEIPGISKRTGSSRRDPEVLREVPPPSPVHRPNLPESDSTPRAGKKPRESRDSPWGGQPTSAWRARGSGGNGPPCGLLAGGVFRGYRLPESRFPAPGGGRRSERSEGRLVWEGSEVGVRG